MQFLYLVENVLVLSKRLRGLCDISSPDCIFIVCVKDENMFVLFFIDLFVVDAGACSKQTQLYFL